MVSWYSIGTLTPRQFQCGYCLKNVGSNIGWRPQDNITPEEEKGYRIYVCPNCGKPSFFDGKQYPGIAYGNKVESIDDTNVESLYEEARNCCSTNSYTAAVFCCRKLLMNIAVSKGASDNLNFFEYVEYLADKQYIPLGAKDWVDHIRKKGNEANHEIDIMGKEDAEELITFIEMILKIIYEFPAKIQGQSTTTT